MAASGPVSEGERFALLNRLREVVGEEEARTLMESLPPVHWHELATKDDIRAIEAEQRRLCTEMDAEFTNLRTEISAEFTHLRTEIFAEFKTLRAENQEHRGEVALQFAKQTRMMVFTMLGLTVPILGAILGVGLT
ncbi:MAG: hypothetical protein OXB92_15435 [Acidimicrobiaceae bacterium]|nr:hypothetical protein [Acidimicrobiia bacterium]MCY4495236.1 hypothetical protein [Acidimicrobiaceae bacterium]